MTTHKRKPWLAKHLNDFYVKKAQQDGYRARAAYKLIQANDKYGFLKPGQIVVDLGSAPGSWSQVAVTIIGCKGRLLALDILDMQPIANVNFIKGDFVKEQTLQELMELLNHQPVDVVLSDMAPNLSGHKVTDQAKSAYLIECAADFAQTHLKPGGTFFTKAFQGAGTEAIRNNLKNQYSKVITFKPASSRSQSKEIYFLASDYTKVTLS